MRRSNQCGAQPAFKPWLTASEIHKENLPGLRGSIAEVEAFVSDARRVGPRFLCRARAHGGGEREVHYTRLPLEAFVVYEARHRPAIEAARGVADTRHARLGSGFLATAHGGQVRAFILQRLVAEPRLPIVGVRDRCFERFGTELVATLHGLPTLVPMPCIRSFQDFVRVLRARELLNAGL